METRKDARLCVRGTAAFPMKKQDGEQPSHLSWFLVVATGIQGPGGVNDNCSMTLEHSRALTNSAPSLHKLPIFQLHLCSGSRTSPRAVTSPSDQPLRPAVAREEGMFRPV